MPLSSSLPRTSHEAVHDHAARLGAVHREVALPEGRLHYVEAGSGHALLLLHGGHGSWTQWIANIAPLAREFRVIALDMPGFGASFNPQPAYTTEQYAATVSRLFDSLSIDRAVVAGFSFGGVVAAITARNEPQRVVRLATVNAPGIGPVSAHSAAIQKELSKLAVTKGLREGALGSLRRLQLYNHELIDDTVVDLMLANVRATRFVSRALSRASHTDRILRDVRQPVQIFIGREDVHRQHGLPEAFRLVPQIAPQAQIHVIERARHWLQFDRADEFNARLAQFAAGAC